MIELIVVLGAFLVFWRFLSHEPDPPPNSSSSEVELAQIPFSWTDDDSSYDNVDVSDQHSTRKESEESVQTADCFQKSLSAQRIQHFLGAND